ncbi:MAG: bifunctional DNA-binding transcriptional regulator/O6-methylguanine-DNA methyltransferase Ada [Anaerolineae bacterium]|nr:bifunctional DNA-binding transcriptional regulator/O6-methylguanine-DNA methyltransferase Ada [Anaerolineae bacterium]
MTPKQKTEDIFWQACLGKDPAFDGQFVLAVRTTGIYCRPSCPARTPRRENVRFFRLPQLAKAAGFRPCKRCQPDEAHPVDPQLELIADVCRFLDAHYQQAITLAKLGKHFHTSPNHLQRLFKAYTGISPAGYLLARRMGTLRAALEKGSAVSQAIYEAGFTSPSRVYERADSMLGMTPAAYRRQGSGERIYYTITDCPLGKLLVAHTERGVCAVRLGDREDELEQTLQDEFRSATLLRDDTHSTWVQTLLAYLESSLPHPDLPLDVRGSAFQMRVWQALQRIPPSETRTYAQVAEDIGSPSAVRAVANACAANPAALVIPCHRVVRSDGGLGGYRWGIERKQKLLEHEQTKGFSC